MSEDIKDWGIIPEYPSYQILKYTKCEYCPKYPSLVEHAHEKGIKLGKAVFIEHFPPEYTDGSKKIMLVGESPGKWEMVHHRPFIGRSGQLLRRALASLGYVRKEPPIIRLLITNSVKCPCVGPPHVNVSYCCAGALAKEADLFVPDLIIGMGKTAFHALTGKGVEYLLGENRKKHFKFRGFTVRLTYHPAAALKNINYKISFYQDLREYLRWLLRNA